MRKILSLTLFSTILFFWVSCGSSERIINKNYNPNADHTALKKKFIQKLTTYKIKFRNSNIQSSRLFFTEEKIIKNNYCFFKTIRPVRRDNQGVWFHRFSLEVTQFKNYSSAVKAVNKTIKKYYNTEEEFREKGWGPLYILIAGKRVYWLHSGFFQAGRLEKIFSKLSKALLRDKKPEKFSVITSRLKKHDIYFCL